MRPRLTRRLHGFGTSVFAEMTALARLHSAVNLGQGYPDFDGPDFVKRSAEEAIAAGHNQYAPMPGLPVLQQAVADHQRRF
jgi:N-succinyldiaminopimelate aminotransferase